MLPFRPILRPSSGALIGSRWDAWGGLCEVYDVPKLCHGRHQVPCHLRACRRSMQRYNHNPCLESTPPIRQAEKHHGAHTIANMRTRAGTEHARSRTRAMHGACPAIPYPVETPGNMRLCRGFVPVPVPIDCVQRLRRTGPREKRTPHGGFRARPNFRPHFRQSHQTIRYWQVSGGMCKGECVRGSV